MFHVRRVSITSLGREYNERKGLKRNRILFSIESFLDINLPRALLMVPL
jgi:hypothetical protein